MSKKIEGSAEASSLCTVCLSIFDSDSEPRALEKDTILPAAPGRRPHHESILSLFDAADSGCFICSTVRAEVANGADCSKENDGKATSSLDFREDIPDELSVVIFLNIPAKQKFIVFHAVEVAKDGRGRPPSKRDEETLRNWVSRCRRSEHGVEQEHKSCRDYRSRFASQIKAPIRTVRLEERSSSEDIWFCLVESQEHGKAEPYATVSQLNLNDQASEPPMVIDIESGVSSYKSAKVLPDAVRESFRVALAAGVHHVWEHSLCSTSASHESERASVISGGIFNIAVIDSTPGSDVGNSTEKAGTNAHPIVHPRWNPTGTLCIVQKKAFRQSIMKSSFWNSTAFHHDIIISPATVFCTRDQYWWQCLEHGGAIISEIMPSAVTEKNIHASDSSVDKRIREHTAAFYARDPKMLALTNDKRYPATTAPMYAEAETPFTDQLVATWTSIAPFLSSSEASDWKSKTSMIEAIAHALLKIPYGGRESSVPVLRFMHGTFSTAIVTQLGWHSNSEETAVRGHEALSQIPTWSWLSIPAGVNYEYPITTVPGVYCTYLEPDAPFQTPVATARFAIDGPLETAINVRGYLLPVQLADIQPEAILPTSSHQADSSPATMIWDVSEERERIDSLVKATLEATYCFWPIYVHFFEDRDILEARGIILRQSGVPHSQDESYVRCGWIRYQFRDIAAGGSHAQWSYLKDIAAGEDRTQTEFIVV